MGTKRDHSGKRTREDTRLKTDLPFEEAVKRLLNTPPPDKESPNRSRESADSRPE